MEGPVDFAGTGDPGALIEVKSFTKVIASTTVRPNGSWDAVSVIPLPAGEYGFQVFQTALNSDVDSQVIYVSTRPADKDVKFTSAVVDDRGIVTYAGTGQPYASVEVTGKSGRVLATTTVGIDYMWTAVSTVALPAQAYTVDASQVTVSGTRSAAEISFEIKNPAKAVTFTGPAANSAVTNSKPVFSGQGEPGAKVIVKGSVRTVATTSVKTDGTWSVRSDIALDNGSYALSAVQTPTNGAAQSTAMNPFVVQYKAAAKLVVATPAADSAVQGPRPTFTGKGDAGATITIKGATRTVASAVVQNDGTWTATSTVDLAKDVYNLTVTQDALNGDMGQATVKFTVR